MTIRRVHAQIEALLWGLKNSRSDFDPLRQKAGARKGIKSDCAPERRERGAERVSVLDLSRDK